MKPENTGPKQGGRFQPGQSGNPAGKPRGARHRATEMTEALLAGDAEEVVRAVIARAKRGDMSAAKLVLDRIAPPRKGARVTVDLPTIAKAQDSSEVLRGLLAAIAAGQISAEEAQQCAGLVETYYLVASNDEFETRLSALEERRRQ